MTDPFDDARQQVLGDALLRDAEAESHGLDPLDAEELHRIAQLAHQWVHAWRARVVAEQRGDAADATGLFGMADRDLRTAMRTSVVRWDDDQEDEQ